MSEALDKVVSSVFDRHHQYAAMEKALREIVGCEVETSVEALADVAVATVARLRAELAAMRGTLCDPGPPAPASGGGECRACGDECGGTCEESQSAANYVSPSGCGGLSVGPEPMPIDRELKAAWDSFKNYTSGPGVTAKRLIRIALSRDEPPAPSAEPFETWHARECPTTGIQARGGKCSGYYVWKGGVHEKWHHRTCHEVWQSETKSAAPASEPSARTCARPVLPLLARNWSGCCTLPDDHEGHCRDKDGIEGGSSRQPEPLQHPEPTAREAALERAEYSVSRVSGSAEYEWVSDVNYALRALLAAIRATDGAR